jgi:hypothetical protein
MFSVAGLTGVHLFYREVKRIVLDLGATHNDPRKVSRGLFFLRLWALMFAFIGLQLSFTLSPFFGLKGKEFIFFTSQNANFFSDLLETIAQLFIRK